MSWYCCGFDLSYYKGSSLAAEFATSIRDPCKPSKPWTGNLGITFLTATMHAIQGTIDVQNELHLTLTCPHHRNTCFIPFTTSDRQIMKRIRDKR